MKTKKDATRREITIQESLMKGSKDVLVRRTVRVTFCRQFKILFHASRKIKTKITKAKIKLNLRFLVTSIGSYLPFYLIKLNGSDISSLVSVSLERKYLDFLTLPTIYTSIYRRRQTRIIVIIN